MKCDRQKLMPKKYIVDLTEVEQKLLNKLTTIGKHAAYKINHARILLQADVNQPNGGWSAQAISKALNISTSTIESSQYPMKQYVRH